jgi:hypothetical protein
MRQHHPPAGATIPYFQRVRGRDGLWWWAKCPVCGRVVMDKDGYGPSRHWRRMEQREATQ